MTSSNSSYIPKGDHIDRDWYIVDAKDQVLGKVAVLVATVLSGKRKPTYTQFRDMGDHVVVINAASVHLTGKKEEIKTYYNYSGYPGGMKAQNAGEVRAKRPAKLIEVAVRGMLPKTRLGEAMYRKLRVYAGDVHPHTAHKPKPLPVR